MIPLDSMANAIKACKPRASGDDPSRSNSITVTGR